MASDNEASCEGNPNFAIICGFLEKFGAQLGITNIDFLQLQLMLEDNHEVAKSLVDLHFKLLRRIKKSVPSIDKWEKTLVKVCHTFSTKDAWEIERFGYKKANLSCKVRILKTLLEMQFDCNTKFKTEINKVRATELRSQPLGRDRLGHAYWFHSDENYQIRVYKEDLDDETWTLVAKDRDSLVSLINALTDGDTKIVSSDSAGNEDSNSLSDKPLLDTGQTDSKKTTPENSDADEEKVKKPEIKLKDLSVLVGPKRNLDDVDEKSSSGDESSKKKKLNDVTHSSVVSDTIEEPVLRVEGEGSGEENKDGNIFFGKAIKDVTHSSVRETIEETVLRVEGEDYIDGNPIVGEAIEEEVMYFVGEGYGVDCTTGNDEKPEEKSSIISKDDNSQSNCNTNQIPISSIQHKLGVIVDSKDDSPSKVLSPTTKRSRWDMDGTEVSEKKLSPDKNDNNSSVSSSSPKKMFFFGSGSSPFKTNMLSPSFASPKNDASSDKNEDTIEECEKESEKSSDEVLGDDDGDIQKIPTPIDTCNSDSDIASKQGVTVSTNSDKLSDNMLKLSDGHQTGVSSVKEDSGCSEKSINEQKNDDLVLDNVYKINESNKTELNNKGNVILGKNSDLVDKIEADEISVTNKENSSNKLKLTKNEEAAKVEINNEDEIENVSGQNDELRRTEDKSLTGIEENKPVVEPVCIKKAAYVCGSESEELSTEISEVPKDEKNVSELCKKELQDSNIKKENGSSNVEDILLEKEKPDNKNDMKRHALEKEGNVTIEEKPIQEHLEETSCSKEENSNKDVDHSSGDKIISHNETLLNKDKIGALRKTVESNNEKTDEKSKINPAEIEREEGSEIITEQEPEVVLVTGRITRSGKFKEAPAVSKPLTITSALRNARKKPKVPPTPVKAKISILDSNKKPKSKKEDPLTIDSFTSEVIEDDVEAVFEKDPFADIEDPLAGLQEEGEEDSESGEEESEEDESDKKTSNVATLGSLSFDFNDSPTPTPIPVIPKARATRKRGRDDTPAAITPSKKMKPKGKRPVNKKLRKSIEQKKQQLADTSSSEEEELKGKKKKGKVVQKKKVEESSEESKSDTPPPKPKPKPKAKLNKNQRMLANLGISEEHFKALTEEPTVRQSRRLAQLKIREQIDPPKKQDPEDKSKNKNKHGKIDDQDSKPEKRKRLKQEKDEASEPEMVVEKKKKKKKEKAPSKLFNEHRPWQSSSDSDEEDEEEEEEEEVVEEEEPHVVEKSDHEFSPESDVGGEDDWQPLKRARTARKESDAEEVDECPCQKCGKSDHPEWILLCDKCDNGWHCSCLRPPMLNIPEGDWFCPPCQHILLLDNLQVKLKEYDKKLSKKEMEDRRKERLAYVGISLENVLPTKDLESSKKKRRRSGGATQSSSEQSSSESESDSDEPIYQLRQRRQARSYKFNEYDEMIKTAIGDELDVPKDNSGAGNLGRGKDIATIVKDMEPEPKPPTVGENGEARPARKKVVKKKHRKLTTLDCESTDEDDYSDEDFKGASTEESEEEEAGSEDLDSEDSEDYVGKKRRKNAGPTRRSTRARTKRYDADFIDDDSDDAPRKKKKKSIWEETDSDESDEGWRGKKSKKRGKDKTKKKKKRKNVIDDSDAEQNDTVEKKKKPKPRIQYGGLTSSEEEETGRGVRTRGKKMTYVDSIGSETEEEVQKKKNPRRIESDDEDFVANDEDKESEDEEKESEGAEGNKEEEEEKEEKRALLVPKIYIKKPMGVPNTNKKPVESKSEEVTTQKQSDAEVLKKNEHNNISVTKESTKHIAERTEGNGEKKVTPTEKKEDKPFPIIPETIQVVRVKPLLTENDIKNSLPPGVSVSRVSTTKEDFASQQFKMVAAKLQEIENKRKQQQEEDLRELMAKKPELQLTRMPVKRGRKPKESHEPMGGHFSSLISNNDDNDDLSEPPGISLPLFEELNPKGDETPKKRRGRGPAKPKKPVDDTQMNLSGDKSTVKDLSPSLKLAFDKANIEIAAPPQPFSQSQPTPSVITRMLQTKPGQTTTYPVGSIRPKQFATMPADDDIDDPPPVRGPSPASAPHNMGGPSPVGGQFGPGGPRRPMGGPPYRGPPGPNHYPRGMPPSHQMRGPPPGIPPHLYHHPHRPLGPSPSGGGPIPAVTENSTPPPQTSSSPGPRPLPPSRFPQIGNSSSITLTPVSRPTPPTPIHNMMHTSRPPVPYSTPNNPTPPPPNNAPPPSAGYYGNYPSPGMSGGDEAMPPSAYQGSPYPDQYSGGEVGSDNSNSKPYEEESGGGEFGGLVSYFSSQREDDLES